MNHSATILQEKSAWKALLAGLEHDFLQGKGGAQLQRELSDSADAMFIRLWRELAPNAAQQVDVVAVGGYGRRELAPCSDWDVWFIMPARADTALQEEVQAFLYALWDLSIKLGYAVRTIKETMEHLQTDWDAVTASVDMRLLTGRGHLYQTFAKDVRHFLKKKRKAFVKAKMEELQERHKRTGNTAFLMEPDVKEGQGGLRDVQAMFWMCKAWSSCFETSALCSYKHGVLSAQELAQLQEAYAFLMRVRVGVHLEAARADDRLNYERQFHIAERMGYEASASRPAVDAFMKDYFLYAGRIARILSMVLMHFEEQLYPQRFALKRNIGDGFVQRGQLIGLKHADVFKEDPLRLLRVFHVAQLEHRRLSSEVLRQIRQDVLLLDDALRMSDEAKSIFIAVLQDQRNVAKALKQMNDTGVLARMIPVFREAVGLGQFNRYHAYTVDEHTLRAVGEARNMLHKDRKTRLVLAQDVILKLKRPELLYIALLFHDIAKAFPGDHSQVGAGIAHDFCCDLGLNKDACALVGWLVREHLTMAMASQRSDLSDPDVIQKFADLVGDQEHLDYLLCLTVADIAAVGPLVWNDWKGTLLEDLYHSTSRAFMGEHFNPDALKKRVLRRIESAASRSDATDAEAMIASLSLLPQRCVLHFPPRQLAMLGNMMATADAGVAVGWHVDKKRSETLLIILTEERAGLFAALTACIASGQISVVAAEAYGLDDGRVLDVFHIHGHDDKPLTLKDDLQRLKQRIEHTLSEPDLKACTFQAPALKPNVLQLQVRPVVRILPLASSRFTACEVTAANRAGLLAQLAHAIAEQNLNLRGASISSFGERVVDVFFVQGKQSDKLTDEEMTALCDSLLKVATIDV